MCAGIPRSGSTWLYNAARLLVQRSAGADQVHGTWIDQYDASHPARVHVVKVHDASESLAWQAKCVLTSRRDVRDIAASAWKRGWISDEAAALAFLENVITQHAFWQPRAAYEMVYEAMRANPRRELVAIAGALELSIEDHGLDATLREIEALGHDDASHAAFDPSNLMHKQHIMDGRVGYHAEALPAPLLATINERHQTWLAMHGYTR